MTDPNKSKPTRYDPIQEDENFYARGLPLKEAQEFKHALKTSVMEEVSMIRIEMAKFLRARRNIEDPELLLKSINTLGLAASRVGRLVKIEYETTGAIDECSQVIREGLDLAIEQMRVKGYPV